MNKIRQIDIHKVYVKKTLLKSVKYGFLSWVRVRPNSFRSKKFLFFKSNLATDLSLIV